MTEPSDRATPDAAQRRAAAMEAIRSAQRSTAEMDAELRRHPGPTSPGTRRSSAAAGYSGHPRPHSSARPGRGDPTNSADGSAAATSASAGSPRTTPAERLADVQATRAAFDAYHRSTRPRRNDRGPLARFVRRYGWRAYALPILAIVTIVALASTDQIAKKVIPTATGAHPAAPQATGPAQAAPSAQLKIDTPGTGSSDQPLISDVLPAGGPYTTTGNGTFSVLPGTTGVIGTGRLFKYTVDVEGGITDVDVNAFAGIVDSTLSDPRSWVGAKNVSLQRVDSGAADFHVTLTSSMTVRKICGYDIPVETSCYDPNTRRVVENVARWVRGDLAYLGDLATYHLYMVNHEVGHALGHRHSHVCLADGFAPVMMQQTLGLKSTTGQICQSNPWPFPPGATDAPGVESADTAANSPIQIPNS